MVLAEVWLIQTQLIIVLNALVMLFMSRLKDGILLVRLLNMLTEVVDPPRLP